MNFGEDVTRVYIHIIYIHVCVCVYIVQVVMMKSLLRRPEGAPRWFRLHLHTFAYICMYST